VYETEKTTMSENHSEAASVMTLESPPADVTPLAVSQGVLARLIDEVRTEKPRGPHAYDRDHNRHNR
jgi:hypothetical protein